MSEGQILLGILSLILYCKDGVMRRVGAMTGEFNDHALGILTRHSAYTENTIKVESAHACMTAYSGLLI